MPALPAGGERSRSSSTFATGKEAPMSPRPGIRARGRPLHPSHPVLARRAASASSICPSAAGSSTRPSPSTPLVDPAAAIRHALDHPVGDREPLRALLRPGMRLTIAFDDISLPLPPMEQPDNRQMVIEQVLDMAADAGVDDVALIVALALHRRMTEPELRHALGDRIYDAFAPNGLLTQHDAEDPDALVHLGHTDQGEDVEINRRAAESRPPGLRQHQPGGHGRRSQERGHRAGQLPEPPSPPQPRDHAEEPLLHGPAPLRAALLQLADGPAHRRQRGKGVPDRDHSQQRHLPVAFRIPPEAGVGVGRKDRLGYLATSKALDRTPARIARQIFHSVKAPHRMTSVQAGEVEAVHALTTDRSGRSRACPSSGQTDILTMGLPYIGPYNVNSILNPILVACLGLGYFFNLYRGKPLVREGGVLIMTHPTPWEFNPVHHPSYIDFFEQVLTETTDPVEMAERSRSRSPPTRGTSISTGPATRTTGSTRSTCGTGAPTPSSTSGR